MKSFLFTLGTTGDGLIDPMQVHVDTFCPLEGRYDFDYHINKDSEFHPVNVAPEEYKRDARTFENIKLRARYANGGTDTTASVYLVKTEYEELTRDDLEMLIKHKHSEGTLKTFLESSKIA